MLITNLFNEAFVTQLIFLYFIKKISCLNAYFIVNIYIKKNILQIKEKLFTKTTTMTKSWSHNIILIKK